MRRLLQKKMMTEIGRVDTTTKKSADAAVLPNPLYPIIVALYSFVFEATNNETHDNNCIAPPKEQRVTFVHAFVAQYGKLFLLLQRLQSL